MATKPKKSAAPPYPGYLSPQRQLKLATQSVSAALSPQTQLAQQQIQQAQTDARNAALGQKDAYAALADVYAKEAPATDQAYTDAANRQATFAKGFSDAMQTIQQQAVDQSNKLLDQNGAPSGQHLSAGSQGDVVYALGGYNPASVLNAQGAAFKTAALGRAGEAKGLGQQAYDEALAKGTANVTTLRQQLAQIQAQRPNLLQQALNSIQGQQSDAYQNYLAANKGQIFGSDKSGYYSINPSTGKITQLTSPAAGATAPKVFGSAKSGYFSLDPDTGKVTQLTDALPPSASGGATHYQVKNVNGHTVVFDPAAGAFYLPTGQPVDPNSLTKAPKPLDATIQRDIVADIRTNKRGGTQIVTADQAATYPPGTKQKTLPSGKVEVAIAPLVDRSKDDPRINNLYTEILGTYGINEQRAFKMVAKYFPGWAARNQRSFLGTQPGTPASAPSNVPAVGLKNRTKVLGYARQLAQKQYGWGPSEFASLKTLWNNESGWNFQAKNPSSGALGIPQALGHALPAGYASDPAVQIQWGLNYIKQRYGSPSKALAFWYGPKPAGLPQGHWY